MPYTTEVCDRRRDSLGGFFDDLEKIAGKVGDIANKVGMVSGEIQDVQAGKKNVALIPTDKATVSIPGFASGFSASVPMPLILGGLGLLLVLALRPRRRR